MSAKPWLVGESNPYGPDPEFALYPAPKGCSGERLCHLILGMRAREYLEAFERRDLLVGKWSVPRAREAAAKLADEAAGAPLLLLGAKVAQAFGVPFKPFSGRFSIGPAHPAWGFVLPHPSGLCRLWHAPGAFEQAREVVRSAISLAQDKR